MKRIPWVISNYVGSGFKGIAIAALIAAIGSSVAAIVNSASTIFTLDIYRPLFMKRDVERKEILTPLENNSSQLTVKEEHHLVNDWQNFRIDFSDYWCDHCSFIRQFAASVSSLFKNLLALLVQESWLYLFWDYFGKEHPRMQLLQVL
jgi:hypothetical protein